MTRSPILSKVSGWAVPAMVLFALWLLWKGHNAPGGGFIGGLLTAAALLLRLMSEGRAATGLRSERTVLVAVAGLAIALTSAAVPALLGYPFFQQAFEHFRLPAVGDLELATALVFDIGVYVVVIGTIVTVITALTERD